MLGYFQISTKKSTVRKKMCQLCVVTLWIDLPDLPGPLYYMTSCRFNCILYIGPTPTGSD